MDAFAYRQGELFCEDVPVSRLAREAGTPLYVYSRATIEDHYRKIHAAFLEVPTQISYSVKANSSLAVLRILAGLGSGFDIVSGGELARVLAVGGDPAKVVYAGVGKSDLEIRAALEAGVGLFNVESEEELHLIDALAREAGKKARVALRVNPDVDPKTHKYITTGKRENKFGVDLEQARGILERARGLSAVEVAGLHAHIGSQITSPAPYRESLEKVTAFLASIRHPTIRVLNCGGGFGASYRGDEAIPAAEFAQAIVPAVKRSGLQLVLEPGRFIVANAGVLLARVEFVKRGPARTFVICDAGMHTLIRPSLYGSFHRIWPVRSLVDPSSVDWRKERWEKAPEGTEIVDVVGPICESGDFLAQDRPLPPVTRGDLLAVFTAGAYGFAMASSYNSHPRPAEVLVEGASFRIVRERETYADLMRGERP